MQIVVQIGYSKTLGRKREGQKIQGYINDVEVNWDDRSGRFITSFADKHKGKLWYLHAAEVESGDAIRIQVFTAFLGGGVDERRTYEAIYVVDENANVQEIEVSGVGARGFPLLKGRVTELGSVSKEDERAAEIEEFLDDENF